MPPNIEIFYDLERMQPDDKTMCHVLEKLPSSPKYCDCFSDRGDIQLETHSFPLSRQPGGSISSIAGLQDLTLCFLAKSIICSHCTPTVVRSPQNYNLIMNIVLN